MTLGRPAPTPVAVAEPAASVVVPTRDRPAALAGCLAALEHQADGGPAFEVVVVDDRSHDPAAVAAVVAGAPHARLLHGAGRGPAAARNLGAAAARGPVVCFTDDDCRPRPGWLAGLLAPIDAGAPAAAGPTRVAPGAPAAVVASQVVTNHLTASTLDPATGRLGFAPTCNLAVRAHVLAAVPFDEGYPLAAGEDREWCDRLAAAGLALRAAPGAVVEHRPTLTAGGFWRQQVRYGRGAHRYLRGRPSGPRLQGTRFYLDLLRSGAAEGPMAAALVVLAQAATGVGLAAEALAPARRP